MQILLETFTIFKQRTCPLLVTILERCGQSNPQHQSQPPRTHFLSHSWPSTLPQQQQAPFLPMVHHASLTLSHIFPIAATHSGSLPPGLAEKGLGKLMLTLTSRTPIRTASISLPHSVRIASSSDQTPILPRLG
jgi:hypothetical protein